MGDVASLPGPLQQRDSAARRRKKLSEFVFTESWGSPAPFVAER
jgi:hypothetical protein